MAAHAGTSFLLPNPWRRRWQAATGVPERAVVADNPIRAGVRVKF